MIITTQMVVDLRKRTGVGMSKCKEALIEANGDIEEAIHILRKKGIASAVKKGGRETKEGIIGIAETKDAVFLVEVNAETDFVIQNERFKEFLTDICDEIAKTAPQSLESFLQKKWSKNAAVSIDEYRAEIVQALGENIQVKRIKEWTKSPNASLGIYSHMGGKIVTLVGIQGAADEQGLARDIAMHVAAESPDYLKPEEIPSDVLAKEEEIARSQLHNKPPEILDKIIKGKLQAHYEQVCLERQKYIKDPSLCVSDYVSAEGKKRGKSLNILYFTRWQIGE